MYVPECGDCRGMMDRREQRRHRAHSDQELRSIGIFFFIDH